MLERWWDQRLAHAVSSQSYPSMALTLTRSIGTVIWNQRDHFDFAWSSFCRLVPGK